MPGSLLAGGLFPYRNVDSWHARDKNDHPHLFSPDPISPPDTAARDFATKGAAPMECSREALGVRALKMLRSKSPVDNSRVMNNMQSHHHHHQVKIAPTPHNSLVVPPPNI